MSRTVDHIDRRSQIAECSRHQQALAEERFRDDLIAFLQASTREQRRAVVARLAAEPDETDEVARMCHPNG